MRQTRGILACLMGVLALGLVLNVEAQSPKGRKSIPGSLKAGIAAATKEKEERVEKILKALGPALNEQLREGREVDIPGVGVFRVVRVNEYKDLVDGRPTTMPAKNYVEFVPNASLDVAANAPGARPARTVDGYEFRINPNSIPGLRTGSSRLPGTRIR